MINKTCLYPGGSLKRMMKNIIYIYIYIYDLLVGIFSSCLHNLVLHCGFMVLMASL